MALDPDLLAAGLTAGLSIEDDLLRVVVVDRRHVPVVVDDAEADLTTGVVRDGRVADQQALSRRIGDLWRALDLGGVPTFVGLQPPGAQAVSIPVASWPPSGWPPEVLTVVSAVRAGRPDDVVWNAAPVRVASGNGARIVSCGREELSRAVWAARSSGVWIAGVELSGLAVERAVLPTAERRALLVDGTRRGASSLTLFDAGVAVAVWRDGITGSGLWWYPLEEETARLILQRPQDVGTLLAGRSDAAVRRAVLVGPGEGLGPRSPSPLAAFAAAAGLALATTTVGLDPVDLQPALLNAGAAHMQAHLGLRAQLLGSGSVGQGVPAVHTAGGPGGAAVRPDPSSAPSGSPMPLPRRERRRRASRWWSGGDPS